MADDILSNATLIDRFAAYFRHSSLDRDVLNTGDEDVACKNARIALSELGIARDGNNASQAYDLQLQQAVAIFQEKIGHRNRDGSIGPGTRKELASRLLREHGVKVFDKLINPKPTVFLSYARADSLRVEKLEQWLEDRYVTVIRDESSFDAGVQIDKKIWESVLKADKVVAVYSETSKNRDWPIRERQIAADVENQLDTDILVYLCIDDTELPEPDRKRLAIRAPGKTLKQIGSEILNSVGIKQKRSRIEYDENEPL